MQKNNAYLLCTMNLPQSLVDKAAEDGVFIDSLPFIQVKPLNDQKIQEKISELSAKSLTTVFTSMHAAEAVIEKLRSQQITPPWKIYCMAGSTNTMLKDYFGDSAIIDTANDASTLAGKIIRDHITEVVFFCGNQRRDELPNTLSSQKIPVREIIVYETALTPHTISKKYNGILFFSPSATTSFFSANQIDKDTTLFAIGNTTANTIKQYTENKIIISDAPGKETLVNSCIKYFQTHPAY